MPWSVHVCPGCLCVSWYVLECHCMSWYVHSISHHVYVFSLSIYTVEQCERFPNCHVIKRPDIEYEPESRTMSSDHAYRVVFHKHFR